MGSAIQLDQIGAKIQGDDLKFERDNVADLLGRTSTNFPGAQPVSFARHHLHELETVDYFLCEKTDGVRCLLFLNQFPGPDGLPVESHFLIDRKNDYYYLSDTQLHLPKLKDDPASFHIGTLLDGELVLQRRRDGSHRLAYLIFDLLALDGESLMDRPFDKRYGRAEGLVIKPFKAFAADPRFAADVADMKFDVQLKKMETPYATEMMFKDKIPHLPHGNDGLIFTCVTTPYVSGTDPHILKWKPPHENTIDFKLQIDRFPLLADAAGEYEDWDAKPDIALLVHHGDRDYRYFAMLTLTDAEWAAMKALQQMFDGRIIECFRDPDQGGAWRPKLEPDGTPRFRDDKRDGNHISVVQSVLESIQDAVSEEELIAAAGRIKHAFKARLAAKEERRREEQKRAAEGERKRREMVKMQQQQQQQQQMAQQQQQAPAEEQDDGPSYDDD